MVMRATALSIGKFACIANKTTTRCCIKPSSDALSNWELIAKVFPNVVRCEEAFSPRNVQDRSIYLILFYACPARVS
jgi:hypothetical protein